MERKYSTDINPKMDGKKVLAAGWVHEIRDLGGLRFIIIRDRTGMLQVTLLKKHTPKELFKKSSVLTRESVISVTGTVRAEPKAPNGYELLPDKIEILGLAASPLPTDPSGKVDSNIDTRLDNRVLDLRRSSVSAVFRVRDVAIQTGREHLRRRGFIEIQTPRIISTSSEGGTELFPVAYFEKEAFLAQSPQLYKQMMMAAGFDRIYELATYFRAEEHNTVWHLNEITALDCELAFIESYEDILNLIESMVAEMINSVRKKCRPQLKTLGRKIAEPKLPFPRITYDEAINILDEAGLRVKFGEDFSTEIEKRLGEVMSKKGVELYFITKYPLKIKPFYTMPDEDPTYSTSFDLEYRGREIISGSQRIHNYDMLLRRIKECGLRPENFKAYLDAFKFGIPPHGGFGLGIERFLTLMLDLPNVREAVLFPRDRKRLVP